MWYDVIIDDRSMKAEGFLATKRPALPSPKKRIKTYSVLSRDGTVYHDTGLYEDMEIDVEFNYMADQSHWADMVRKLHKLVLNAKALRFQDDPHYFRKIKTVSIGDTERTAREIGTVTVTFTVDPYAYQLKGNHWYDSPTDYQYNDGDTAHPVYKLTGSGRMTLTVNGYKCQTDVYKTAYLDSDLGICYGDDGENRNATTNADYMRLWLKPGKNTLSLTGGTLTVLPRWREL